MTHVVDRHYARVRRERRLSPLFPREHALRFACEESDRRALAASRMARAGAAWDISRIDCAECNYRFTDQFGVFKLKDQEWLRPRF